MAQQVEHVLGKDEVTGSSPVSSSKKVSRNSRDFFFFQNNLLCYVLQFSNAFLYIISSINPTIESDEIASIISLCEVEGHLSFNILNATE